jgi:hypothetical protein
LFTDTLAEPFRCCPTPLHLTRAAVAFSSLSFTSRQSVVYDVTKAANFYGPEGGYHCFAGRDASIALAKLSFEETSLVEGETGAEALKKLSAAELDQLQEWIDKFEMKGYPVVGRLVIPPPCKVRAFHIPM